MNKINKCLFVLFIIFGLLFSSCSNNEEITEESLNTIANSENNDSELEQKNDVLKKEIESQIDEIDLDENNIIFENESKEPLEEEIVVDENSKTNIITDKVSQVNEIVSNDSGVEVSVNSDNQVVIETNSNRTIDESLSIDEWCLVGEKFEFESEGGDVSSTIVGPETFKEKEYCMAQGETVVSDMSIPSTYYFNNGATDVWVVLEIFGQVTEQNIILN